MVFNGLSGSDLVVFNALYRYKDHLPQPIPANELVRLTGYHRDTVLSALNRLDQCQIIRRRRDSLGQPYIYEDIEDYDFPHT